MIYMEKKISIKETNKGDKTYYNIMPKKELEAGDYIVVQKLFDTGRELETDYGKCYSVTLQYDGKDVGMLMSNKEYTEFCDVGNVGDKIKMVYTSKVAKFRKDGKEQERKYLGLKFEKV
ncbi:MAG TPA: hypothetical protein V6C58_22560 [Allocoleopsis sp.]